MNNNGNSNQVLNQNTNTIPNQTGNQVNNQTVNQVNVGVAQPQISPNQVAQTSQQAGTIQDTQPNNQTNNKKATKPKKSKGKTLLIILLLFVIGGLAFYIYTDYQKDLNTICSPLAQSDGSTTVLDLNSTIVEDLYSKVKTTVREDVASNELNDAMKLYLAYRQIPESKIYDSNCNLFDNAIMPSVACESSLEFSPRAFKEETLQMELKKLFGESTNIANANIQLGNSCFGGFQYIAERGEYVEGRCNEVGTTLYKVDKELIEATVTGDTITLKEKVRYYSGEGVNVDRLTNGTYVYTFKLDANYNYAYISRTIE